MRPRYGEPMKKKKKLVTHDEATEGKSLLEELVSSQPKDDLTGGGPRSFVGECIDERHPTISGRILVQWATAGGEVCKKWLACLQTTTVRTSDRVLLLSPENWVEPVVIGVLGGFQVRPQPDRDGPSIALKPDEAVNVTTDDGDKILQIHQEESGPVVRLLSSDVDIDLPGKLRIRADDIEIKARKGAVDIEASDDVRIKGERVKMN